MKPKIICFDLDNTICTTVSSNYKKSKPKKKIIHFINQLYDQGFYIKIFTSRYMGRTKDKVSLSKKKTQDIPKNNLRNGD